MRFEIVTLLLVFSTPCVFATTIVLTNHVPNCDGTTPASTNIAIVETVLWASATLKVMMRWSPNSS